MCNVDKMQAASSKHASSHYPLQNPTIDSGQMLTKSQIACTSYIFHSQIQEVDLWQVQRNHKDAKCKENYNPDVLKELIPKLNTPVAEQTFIWAARFKKILGAMPKSHFLFFYHRMVVRRNRYTEKCYKNNVQPILPKVRSENSS